MYQRPHLLIPSSWDEDLNIRIWDDTKSGHVRGCQEAVTKRHSCPASAVLIVRLSLTGKDA
jgi:hypothetical protein